MCPSKGVTNLLLNLLFPQKPYCALCDARLSVSDLNICGECDKKITSLIGPMCRKCGKPLSVYLEKNSEGFLCNDCKNEYHFFEEARAFGAYKGALKELINQFKYQGRRNLSELLSTKMFYTLSKLPWPTFDYIIPVPLHKKRELERGFNQALLLAKGLSTKTGIPILNALNREKPTQHQTLLDKSLRKQNLEGAFKIVRGNVKDKTLLLIDDVYTTGATVDACSKILKEAGVMNVFVLTCARG